MKVRNRKWTFLILFWIYAFPSFSFAQTEFDERCLDPENENFEKYLEFIDELKSDPLDINSATSQQLEAFPFFTSTMAKKIFHEKNRRGPFQNLQDFQNRLHLDESEIEWFAPYIRFSRAFDLAMDNRMYFIQELPLPEGIRSGKYKGSWYKSGFRLKWNYANRMTSGILIQKDPGEPQWNDHSVGFLQGTLLENANSELSIVLGNFSIEAGQGLVLWGPYGLFKGSDPIGVVKKRSERIKGYISSDESKALQGSAFCFKTKVMAFTGFFSSRHLDACIQPSGNVSCIETSGLHRTENEMNTQNALTEKLGGARIALHFSKARIGATFWQGKYNPPFFPLDLERDRFGFRGKINQIIGMDWDFWVGPFNGFGEMARSISKGMAFIVGMMVSDETHELALLVRHYDPHFQNPKANGFGGIIPENETGGYLGWRFRILEKTNFLFYFDLYRRPWRTYFFPLPTSGIETSFGIQSQWTKGWSTYFRIKIQEKEMRNLEAGPPFIDYTKTRYQLEFYIKPTTHFRLRSGGQGTALLYPKFSKKETLKNEQGIMIFHDLQWQIHSRYKLNFRWSTFDTDSYETRLYVFEYEFPGVFHLLPCYKKGERFSMQLQWKITSHWTLSAKYALLTHVFEKSWGTGNDRIPQNVEKKWGICFEGQK